MFIIVSFDKLWITLEKNNISQYSLINDYNISAAQLGRLKNNANVTTNTINYLCEILNCDISDIMEYSKE